MLLLKLDSIRHKGLRSLAEHSIYLFILFGLIPVFLYFELVIVLPATYENWSLPYVLHIILAAFLLVNVVGNMLFGMLTDTSIKQKFLDVKNKDSWILCAKCEGMRPPRSWHCDMCDICILKRDHHCTYFACCVGYYNQRYFMAFILHIFIAMLIAFYYNVKFLSTFILWNNGLVIMKFIFPFASFIFDFGKETCYIFVTVINFIAGCFTGFLLVYHINNILKGKTTPESNAGISTYDYGWKRNLVEVFGSRWYLTWTSPFIHSPLPGNGIEWDEVEKYK